MFARPNQRPAGHRLRAAGRRHRAHDSPGGGSSARRDRSGAPVTCASRPPNDPSRCCGRAKHIWRAELDVEQPKLSVCQAPGRAVAEPPVLARAGLPAQGKPEGMPSKSPMRFRSQMLVADGSCAWASGVGSAIRTSRLLRTRSFIDELALALKRDLLNCCERPDKPHAHCQGAEIGSRLGQAPPAERRAPR